MTKTELLWAYEEYCEECRWEGKTPKPFWVWAENGK